MLVRQVGISELERLKEIRLRALLDSPGAFGSSYELEAARSHECWRPWIDNGCVFVVEGDDRWLGLTAVSLDGEHRSICHLASMWTDPGRRGLGLGRRLLDSGMQWARDNGATVVRLGVVHDNETAHRLYQRAGFEPTGEQEPLRSQPSKTVIYMERHLAVDPG